MKINVITAANDAISENTGIGDGLLTIPFLYGLKRKHLDADIKLLCRSHQLPLCSLFWDNCKLQNPKEPLPESDILHRTCLTGFWSSEDILAEQTKLSRLNLICTRFYVEPNYDFKPLIKQEILEASYNKIPNYFIDKITRPIVVIAPSANVRIREWPVQSYVWLAYELKKLNYRIVFIGHMSNELQKQLFQLKIISFPKLLEVDLIGLLQKASLFIGNDSGVSHLAGLLNTQALTICGPSNGKVVFGSYKSIEPIQATKLCSGCLLRNSGRFKFDDNCSGFACRALYELTVENVLSKVLSKLS